MRARRGTRTMTTWARRTWMTMMMMASSTTWARSGTVGAPAPAAGSAAAKPLLLLVNSQTRNLGTFQPQYTEPLIYKHSPHQWVLSGFGGAGMAPRRCCPRQAVRQRSHLLRVTCSQSVHSCISPHPFTPHLTSPNCTTPHTHPCTPMCAPPAHRRRPACQPHARPGGRGRQRGRFRRGGRGGVPVRCVCVCALNELISNRSTSFLTGPNQTKTLMCLHRQKKCPSPPTSKPTPAVLSSSLKHVHLHTQACLQLLAAAWGACTQGGA